MGKDHPSVIQGSGDSFKTEVKSRWHKLRARSWFVPVMGGLLVGALNLLYYQIIPLLSPGMRAAGIAVGGPLATSLSWTEKTLTGGHTLFPGVPAAFSVLIVGLVVGSFLSALASRELTWTAFRKSKLSADRAVKALMGGVLVGFGVLLANGCLIKHGLSGAPGLSLEAFAVLAGILFGIWTMLRIMEWRQGA